MLENAIISDGVAPNTEVVPETAKAKFERERLSRRQALKRLGMTSAMTAFAMFSVDDLARMVGKAMQQRAGDNKVAEQVAKELQQAGVALAAGPGSPCNYYTDPASWNCCRTAQAETQAASDWFGRCQNDGVYTLADCNATYNSKLAAINAELNQCNNSGNALNEPSCACTFLILSDPNT